MNTIKNIENLIYKANIENEENKRKAFLNLDRKTEDIESYNNTNFLNMISKISEILIK